MFQCSRFMLFCDVDAVGFICDVWRRGMFHLYMYVFIFLTQLNIGALISVQRMSVKLLSWCFYFRKNHVEIQVQGF